MNNWEVQWESWHLDIFFTVFGRTESFPIKKTSFQPFGPPIELGSGQVGGRKLLGDIDPENPSLEANWVDCKTFPGLNKSSGGCRKFLLLFGRIGPLALRPCALLRAWGFLPHSINILQIPWWYGHMDWYGMSCARPCALLRGPAFWCLYIMLSKSYLPRRCDWKDGVFYKTPSMFNGEYGGFEGFIQPCI